MVTGWLALSVAVAVVTDWQGDAQRPKDRGLLVHASVLWLVQRYCHFAQTLSPHCACSNCACQELKSAQAHYAASEMVIGSLPLVLDISRTNGAMNLQLMELG